MGTGGEAGDGHPEGCEAAAGDEAAAGEDGPGEAIVDDAVVTVAEAVTAGGLGVGDVLADGEDGIAVVGAKEGPGAPAGLLAGGE